MVDICSSSANIVAVLTGVANSNTVTASGMIDGVTSGSMSELSEPSEGTLSW